MKANMRVLPFCCGVQVIGDFGTDEYTCSKQEIIDECENGTGTFISTFTLDDDDQRKAFEKLSKWFQVVYRGQLENESTGNIVTIVIFDTKPL
jgi:hypothetical protein